MSWWRTLPRVFVAVLAVSFSFAVLTLVVLAMWSDTSQRSKLLHSEPALLLVGVVNATVGSLQTACGYCAQRLAHQLHTLLPGASTDKPDDSSRIDAAKTPLLVIGVVLIACGAIAAIVNLGILGQSVTAPFAALTLIFNSILAWSVLKETLTKFDLLATVLVIGGVAIAMVGVGRTNIQMQHFRVEDLHQLFFRSIFPTLYASTLLALVILSYGYVVYHSLQHTRWGLSCFSIGTGVLSGFASLCIKCAVELVKTAAQADTNEPISSGVYLLVGAFAVLAICQLRMMTTGLRFFGTLKFVPPYHVFIIFSNLANGMVFFDEGKAYDWNAAALFGLGCGIAISGVLLLLGKVPRTPTEQEIRSYPMKEGIAADGNLAPVSSSSEYDAV